MDHAALNGARAVVYLIWASVALVPFILCLCSLWRGNVNKKCVLSLLLLLGSGIVNICITLLARQMEVPPFILVLQGVFGTILALAACVLAICGLIEFPQVGSRHGRKRAVLALVWSVAFLLLAVPNLVIPNIKAALETSAKNSAMATDYHSPTSGFSVKLAGTLWTKPMANLAKRFPSAEFGRSTAKDDSLVVIPLALGKCDPNLDFVAKGMMARWDLVFPGDGITNLRKTVHGPLSGYAFEFTRTDGSKVEYSAEILMGNGFAYLLAAFGDKGKAANPALAEILTNVEFDAHPKQPAIDDLAQTLRESHAQHFNEIGLVAYRREAYPVAESCFRRAHDLDPETPIFIGNTVDALAEKGEIREALDFLKASMHGAGDTPALRAKLGWIQKENGDLEGAVNSYTAAFSKGLHDDSVLQDFAALLCQQKKCDQALEMIEKYIIQHDSIAVRLAQAFVYREQRQFDAGLKMLREQQQKRPGNVQIGMSIARTLFAAERYDETVKECQGMIANGQTTGEVYYQKGRAEYYLKHYKEAKSSLEAALKESPTNSDYKSYLDHLSGMLGQGANTVLKEPIEPVAIPAELLNPPAVDESAAYFRGYGAYYVKHAWAVAFQKEKEHRTTEYRTIKVLDDSGVNKFSSFEIAFDPLDEEIFVNELSVKDGAGKLLSTGKVDDYYVIDDTSSGHAVQNKMLHIPVSGVRPGCEITLTVTRRTLGNAREFRFGEYGFSRTLPVARNLLFVSADRDKFKASATSGLAEQKSEKGVYWMQDQPPIYTSEPFQPYSELYLPTVWLSAAGTTWKDASKEYLTSIEDRLVLDDATRALAKETAGQLKTTEEKVLALTRFVQKEITYKAIEFGRRARIPDKTAVVAKNRYGDCKDHALLLRQLLEAMDIHAHLVLANMGGEIRNELPSLDQFNHMIVFVPSLGKGTFIDCTDKDSAIGTGVPVGLAKKEVLVLDEKNPRLATIPDYVPEANNIALSRRIEVVDNTDALVKDDVVLNGYPASWYRNFFKRTESANRKKALQDDLAGCAPTLEILELGTDGIDDASAPLNVHVSYRIKGRFRSAGNQMMGQLPAVWERMFLAMDTVQNRRSPVWIYNPVNVESHIAITLPHGYAADVIDPVQLDTQYARCSGKSTPEAGALRLDCKAYRPSGSYPAAQYSACQETLTRVMGAFEQNIVLKKTN